MRNSLAVQIRNAGQYLLKAAFNFAWRHSALLNCGIEVTAWTEFHHLAPMLVFVLDKVHGFDYVDMMESRGDAKLGC